LRHCLSLDRRAHSANWSARRHGGSACLALLFGLALPFAASATIDERFGEGMPLVLKDGRIANVTVHAIPFETGAGELDPATAETVRTMFEPLATDCFLTAQAIGHVAPGITRDGDTLSAHRLARARADTIQAALAGFGMPQPSVASVWDWQFLLQKSQVTLWVFSLTQGDDCDGTPLSKGEPILAAIDGEAIETTAATPVASVDTPAQPTTREPAQTTAATTTTAPATTAPATTATIPPATAEAAAPRELRVAGATADSDGDTESPIPTEATAASQSEPAARDPLATAAVAPAEPATSPATPAPTPAEPSTAMAAIDPDTARVAGAAGAPALAITFEMNSSYFPAGAGRELRAFLDSLPTDGPVEIELLGAVGSSAVRGASDEEAQRYNAWMAERRIERVVEWLEQNAGNRQITFAERLVENDSSRQVRLRASLIR
jgi:hypothetical protein